MNGSELAAKSVLTGWRARLHQIIYEADTPAGKLFDALLISVILLSVLCVMLDSVAWISAGYGGALYAAEWFFTILFTIEYALRLVCVARPMKYAASFFGVIDILAIIPAYIDLFVPGGRYLLIVRVLRVLRIFRTFKLFEYLDEGMYIVQALRASRKKISIFLATVMTVARNMDIFFLLARSAWTMYMPSSRYSKSLKVRNMRSTRSTRTIRRYLPPGRKRS